MNEDKMITKIKRVFNNDGVLYSIGLIAVLGICLLVAQSFTPDYLNPVGMCLTGIMFTLGFVLLHFLFEAWYG